MQQAKNVCKYCGGRLVVEYFGHCGSVYLLKENGEPEKVCIKRTIYEEKGGFSQVYCADCHKLVYSRHEKKQTREMEEDKCLE